MIFWFAGRKFYDKQNKNKASRKCLMAQVGLPEWYEIYTYVLNGYRVKYNTCQCAVSLFAWHNETINAWTEFIPCVFMIYLHVDWILNDPAIFKDALVFTKVLMITCFPFTYIRPLMSGFLETLLFICLFVFCMR